MQEFFVDGDGVRLNVARQEGEGVPLLLLHGGSARWQAWQSLLPFLRGLSLIAPDFRGHGRSGWTPGAYSLDRCVADLAAAVPEKVVVFGHSFGAHVGLLFAARYPQRVSGLLYGDAPISNLRAVLQAQSPFTRDWQAICGGTLPRQHVLERLRQSAAGRSLDPRHPWFDFMSTSLVQHDPDFLAAVLDRYDEMYTSLHIELFRQVQCPLLLLQADAAMGGLLADVDVTASGAACHRLGGIGHALHNESPAGVGEVLLAFYARVAGLRNPDEVRTSAT
jgi:pimeloyl-ACP methyl ester carboxylesterase